MPVTKSPPFSPTTFSCGQCDKPKWPHRFPKFTVWEPNQRNRLIFAKSSSRAAIVDWSWNSLVFWYEYIYSELHISYDRIWLWRFSSLFFFFPFFAWEWRDCLNPRLGNYDQWNPALRLILWGLWAKYAFYIKRVHKQTKEWK